MTSSKPIAAEEAPEEQDEREDESAAAPRPEETCRSSPWFPPGAGRRMARLLAGFRGDTIRLAPQRASTLRASSAWAMLQSNMSSFLPTLTVLLLASLAAGCGGRSALGDAAGDDTPRVADCVRRTPDAVPLARIARPPGGGGADAFHFTSDKNYLYFASEGRIWRVAKASGAPQPLTPAGSAGGRVVLGGDSVFWSRDGQVFRAPAGGGDPELIGTAPGEWTISGQDLVTTGPAAQPAPVTRTPFGGGPSQEILPADPQQSVNTLVPVGDGVLVQRSQDLVLIPASSAPLQLAEATAAAGGFPMKDGGFAYFGAVNPLPTGTPLSPALQRVATGGDAAPEILLDGFPVALAIAGDTLYVSIIFRRPGQVFAGALVRLPRAGGAPTVMATTDGFGMSSSPISSGVYGHKTGGLEADGGHIYFIEKCTDHEEEYRLVSLPVDHVTSL